MTHYTFYLVPLTLFLLTSCRELVRDDFPAFAEVPVVHSILKVGEPVEVHLSWTASLDTSRLKVIDHAAVALYVNGQYAETLAYAGRGIYTATTVVAPSVRYRCEVNVPGCDVVVAADSLPKAVAPVDVRYIPIAGRDEEGFAYPAVRFTFANNPAERRYYEAYIYELYPSPDIYLDPVTGEWKRSDTVVEEPVQPGPVTDPILQSEGLPIHVFSNELITGDSYTMTINMKNSSYGSVDGGDWEAHTYPTILELRSVSYDYYRYVKQCYLYGLGFEPEFGRSAQAFPLFSNVGGGYGIFAGYAAAVSDTLNVESLNR